RPLAAVAGGPVGAGRHRPRRRRPRVGGEGGPRARPRGGPLPPAEGVRGDTVMSETLTLPHSSGAAAPPAPVPPSPWLAALAIVPVLATVYQTLVLTDVTDDVIRKGIQGDPYDKVWVRLTWGAAILYGVFLGVWG